MKILIVSTFFPPENSIASLRPYSWAKWWTRIGHDVTVLTTLKEKKDNSLALDCSNFNIIETPSMIPFRKSNKEVKDAVFSTNNKSIKIKILSFLKLKYAKFTTKTGCFLTCRYPDWNDNWVRNSAKYVNPNNFDLLVTTGGPYSVHRIGLYFRKEGWNGKWICDWRDLWTQNHMFPGIIIFHPYERYLENKFHKNANVITTVSEPLADALRSITKTPIEVIYNGYDNEDFSFLFSNEREINKKFIISYLGTIYRPFQDPKTLFTAISELDKEGLISPEDIKINFAGAQADVIDYVQKYGINDYYEYLGLLPREEALKLQYNSDAVLFLECENTNVKGVLTGKLFEYLYISRLIIAIGCTNKTSSGELIESTNSGICFGHNVEKIKNFILDEVRKKRAKENYQEFEKDFSKIKDFSRKIQAEKMLNLVGNGEKLCL